MDNAAQAVPISKGQLWTGRVLSTIGILFMLFDTVIHAMRGPQVVQGFFTCSRGHPYSARFSSRDILAEQSPLR